jgi:hypothetical protein
MDEHTTEGERSVGRRSKVMEIQDKQEEGNREGGKYTGFRHKKAQRDDGRRDHIRESSARRLAASSVVESIRGAA